MTMQILMANKIENLNINPEIIEYLKAEDS
jgi:hypothetical protein